MHSTCDQRLAYTQCGLLSVAQALYHKSSKKRVWLCMSDCALDAGGQVTESARESPLQAGKVLAQPEQTAVVAFTARYFSGLPFQVALAPRRACVQHYALWLVFCRKPPCRRVHTCSCPGPTRSHPRAASSDGAAEGVPARRKERRLQ